MSVFWALYQQRAIHDAAATAGKAEARATNAKEHLRLIEDKIDSLALLCQAQWELIRERTGLTEEDIEEKMREIDLRDGRADGKMGGQAAQRCPACARPLHRRHRQCMYCGQAVQGGHRFQV